MKESKFFMIKHSLKKPTNEYCTGLTREEREEFICLSSAK